MGEAPWACLLEQCHARPGSLQELQGLPCLGSCKVFTGAAPRHCAHGTGGSRPRVSDSSPLPLPSKKIARETNSGALAPSLCARARNGFMWALVGGARVYNYYYYY